MEDTLPLFNVRVYGILFNGRGVLVSDEIQYGRMITKFPGGGLQYGEGTVDCLKREFREELNIEIEILKHFYTVDFFQPSAFHNRQQVISIYYLVHYNNSDHIKTSSKVFDFPAMHDKSQSFRWLQLDEIITDSFTLPIDQKVGSMLKNYFEGEK